MCNCGKKRTEYSHTNYTHTGSAIDTRVAELKPGIAFQYTGKTALTVMGSVTGTRYRFSFTGDIKEIDYRDAAGMTGIPVLQRK